MDYVRITFVSKTSQERLTVDTRLTYRNDGHQVDYNGLVIAEVKQGSARDKSVFVDLMREHSIPNDPSVNIASGSSA